MSGENRATHPNRQVGRGSFLPAAEDYHTSTPEAAAAYASNSVSYRDLQDTAHSYRMQGKIMPRWLTDELYDDD